MRRLLHLLSRAHRAETVRERVLCDARQAIAGARRSTRWLAKRPFSDKHGYDGLGAGPESSGRHNDARYEP